jgi:glycine cleavage system aminomethyltransferase T
MTIASYLIAPYYIGLDVRVEDISDQVAALSVQGPTSTVVRTPFFNPVRKTRTPVV